MVAAVVVIPVARFVKIVVAWDIVIMVSVSRESARVIIVVASVVPIVVPTVGERPTVTTPAITAVVRVPMVSSATVDVIAATDKVAPVFTCRGGGADVRERHNRGQHHCENYKTGHRSIPC
jgi:hypothetical protein